MKYFALLFTSFFFSVFVFADETLKQCSQSKLTADSLSGSRVDGVIVHRGNVNYCDPNAAFSADNLTLRRQKDNVEMHAEGTPVKMNQTSTEFKLNVNASSVNYEPQKLQFSFFDNVKLNLESTAQNFSVSGRQLQYQFQKDEKLKPASMRASGTPLKLELNNQTEKLSAEAKHLNFDYQSNSLTLEGDVRFLQAGDLIKAEKLIYNTKDKSWEVPSIKNKRIEIIKKSKL
ncbi:LptA/OstA family protein [Pleionea sediminis]|uniref:LptA/OstA family protein n=1 Tax=Pleionea sediminis TaxID=2569479 RepID=UPI001184E78D|nr:LptA/OstA family protein [Pleionea sediminis]